MATFAEKIIADIKQEFKTFCAWFGTEEQTIVIAAKPALIQLGKLAATDAWNTILAGAPVIAASAAGNYEAAAAAALVLIKNTLEKEAIVLTKSALGIATNIVVSQVEVLNASGAVPIPAPTVAPVVTVTPGALVPAPTGEPAQAIPSNITVNVTTPAGA